MIPRESQPATLLPHPDPFRAAVRDALLRLYDLASLQTSLLLLACPRDAAAHEPGGKLLRRELLSAIEMLRPANGTPSTSRPWRLYRILELRYIDEEDVAAIMAQLPVSKSEYHREHQRALAGVAALLRERWHVPPDWDPQKLTVPTSPPESLALLEDEVTRLQDDHTAMSLFHPAGVIREVLRLLDPLCKQQRVDVQTDFPAFIPALSGDQMLFRHALLILLTHAMSKSAPLLDLRLRADRDRVTLTIASFAAKQNDEVKAGIEESRPFLEKLDGRVALTQQGQAPGVLAVELSIPVPKHKRLLVVDNNADFAELVARYLEDTNWRAVKAMNVEDALHLAALQLPQAVLLDIMIPNRDGWECLETLKRIPATQHVPVVVCSVLDEPGVAFTLGAAAFLPKPINARQLRQALDRLATPAIAR